MTTFHFCNYEKNTLLCGREKGHDGEHGTWTQKNGRPPVATTLILPWPKAISHYDSDGPRDGEPVEFGFAGTVLLRVSGTDELAPHTLRTRYKVECLTCGDVMHEATTGPTSRIRDHLKEAHGFVGKLEHLLS